MKFYAFRERRYLLMVVLLPMAVFSEEPVKGNELEDLKERVHRLEMENKADKEAVHVHGILVGNVQTQSLVNSASESKNESRGTFVFQPEVRFAPTERDEFFVKFGFAGGNGLAPVSPFVLSPWAGGGEDSVVDINGRNRDYLLTSWYKRSLSDSLGRMEIVGGIIDATDYLDENSFANDEFSQFMNEALVNGAHVFAPSYDMGGAVHLEAGAHSLNVVAMSVGENDDGNPFAFYGLQYGAAVKSALGEGHYRFIFESTNKKFLDVSGSSLKNRYGGVLSFDQEVGPILGGWIRAGVQDGGAAINFQNLYSGGVNVRGELWGRPSDNVGIGHALLNGGNKGIDRSTVTEAYWRIGLTETVAFNLDVQHLRDTYVAGAGDSQQGWVSGLMVRTEF